MRVVTGMLVQESNTFSPLRSDRTSFESGCLLFDDACFQWMAGKRTELAGFVAAARRAEVDLVPTIAAWAPSGGPMVSADFHRLVDELLDRIERAGAVDGVLLAFHGAWVSRDEPDADGWVLERVRGVVGPAVPIVASLDLHANVTRRMIRSANGLVGFRTYPHVDMFETGERAGELLFSALRSGRRLATMVCKAPMIIPPENAQTDRGPLAEVLAAARQAESRPGICSVTIFPVQPWLDVPELGCGAVVVADGEGNAQHAANQLAEMLWERRHAFRVPLVPPDEAVQRALSAGDGPILLVDSADGTSSGSPGDSTAILHALLAASPPATALVSLVDPLAARFAVESDGHEISLAIGGRLDPERHQPVDVTGRARRVRKTVVTFTGGIGDGLTADMGAAAVLEVGEIKILLMENPVPCYDPVLYRAAELEPRDARIVVVKSPNNFRWAYRDVARDWIYVDSPGASSPRLEALRFECAPRPLYPLDDWNWHPQDDSSVGEERRA
jgi:microcystin degradation protein MlrC